MEPYSNGELAQMEQAGRNAERCVCCGAIIPEGRQVCQTCENAVYQPRERIPCAACRHQRLTNKPGVRYCRLKHREVSVLHTCDGAEKRRRKNGHS